MLVKSIKVEASERLNDVLQVGKIESSWSTGYIALTYHQKKYLETELKIRN
jgi:hypothetical protein